MSSTLPADERPLHIVFNAASGSGDAQDAQREMQEILNSAQRSHQFLIIEDPAHLPDLAQRAVDAAVLDGGAVVVAGGDGTIAAVVEKVLPTGRPFGIVPQGTFNYSSRAHGIPHDTAEATRALLNARLKPIQVGLVNERVFLVNASVGLYPEILEDGEAYKRQLGRKRAVALWATLVTVLREGHRKLDLQVEHDCQRENVRTPTLFVGNNPLQLERVGLPEAEDVQRDRLAAVIVRPVGMAKLLMLVIRGALAQLGQENNVRNFAFTRMTVQPMRRHGGRAIKVARDGEITWMRPPLIFSAASRKLMLMVPMADAGPEPA